MKEPVKHSTAVGDHHLHVWTVLICLLLLSATPSCRCRHSNRVLPTKNRIKLIDAAITLYYQEHERLPAGSTKDILHAIGGVIHPKYFTSDGSIRDGWGNPILVEADPLIAGEMLIWSWGPNGRPDKKTADDIVWHVRLEGQSGNQESKSSGLDRRGTM